MPQIKSDWILQWCVTIMFNSCGARKLCKLITVTVIQSYPLCVNSIVCLFFLPLPRVPFDSRHAKQWIKTVPKQQPPGSPEETDWHRTEGQTGRWEHDPDVFQRILQGTYHLTGYVKSMSSGSDIIIIRFDSPLESLGLYNCSFMTGMYLPALLDSLV